MRFLPYVLAVIATLALPLRSAAASAEAPPVPVRFSLIKTAEVTTLQAFTYAGGSLFRTKRLNHVAVLVEHLGERFLFDAGLGSQVDRQFKQDMPWWGRLLFRYEHLNPARHQLEAGAYLPVPRIILSHGHWDHASGITDFPAAEVWLPAAEAEFLKHPHPAAVLPSQVDSPAIRWREIPWDGPPEGVYPRSHDMFGDRSVILVPMAGHTPGSIGMFVTVKSGRRFFFVGDVVWNLAALAAEAPKFFVASRIVDDDQEMTMVSIRQLQATLKTNPALNIVPAHDAEVHDRLGYFPNWIE